jgi:ferredoxin
MTVRAGFVAEISWKAFIDRLTSDYLVYGPQKQGDTVIFLPVMNGESLCLDRPAAASPKGLIFPQSETFFRFEMKKNKDHPQNTDIILNDETENPDVIVVGLRPCDAKGFALMDAVFYDKDPYYRQKRDHTTLITLACNKGFSSCFCTSVGLSPSDKGHSDVLVTPVSGGYYVEVLSEKGRAILAPVDLEDSESRHDEADQVHAQAKSQIKKVFEEGANVHINSELFGSNTFWDRASEKCISCGACTYLCPTCYCFNITDEMGVNDGKRIRSWDSCMFSHYSREASGHNPRSGKSQRLKNRIGHKFVNYPETYGDVLCSGCGRCIRHCPVSVDISRIVSSLSLKTGSNEKEAL